jgi:predicted GNAT superfamily acetyltransferase
MGTILELNQEWVPAVGSLTESSLAELIRLAQFTAVEFTAAVFTDRVPSGDERLTGFVIALGPGVEYASPNYQYFARRHEAFTYVDRIAVDPGLRGSGVGRRLYKATAQHALAVGSPLVCCEVNLDPPNPDSMAFHERMGFTEVGTQWTYDNTVRVRMLECASDQVGV